MRAILISFGLLASLAGILGGILFVLRARADSEAGKSAKGRWIGYLGQLIFGMVLIWMGLFCLLMFIHDFRSGRVLR